MKFLLVLAVFFVATAIAMPQNGLQFLDEAIKQAQSEGKFEQQYTIVSMQPSNAVYEKENIPASERIDLQQILSAHGIPSETITDLQSRIDQYNSRRR